jgi:hypothetical protein
MKQNIWTSGSRQGTGKLRWCGTDKPLNVFWPWSQSLANYNTQLVDILVYSAMQLQHLWDFVNKIDDKEERLLNILDVQQHYIHAYHIKYKNIIS